MSSVVNWLSSRSGQLGGKALENTTANDEQSIEIRFMELMLKLKIITEEELSGG